MAKRLCYLILGLRCMIERLIELLDLLAEYELTLESLKNLKVEVQDGIRSCAEALES